MIGFFIALTPMGRRHWRVLTLWAVTVVLFSSTALSVISGRNEPFYLSVVLMVTGAAALLPWESRWQLSLNGVALAMMVVQTIRVPDDWFEIHWLTGLIAIGLAQASVVINEHYRRAIDKARMAAMEASEAKSGFLASMSHEIRTPMNAIVGLAEVLGETPLTNEQRRYVNTMFANGKSLLELINNILDLAKIESGRLTTVDEEFDVGELSETIAESLALRAHEKNLELTVWVDPELPSGRHRRSDAAAPDHRQPARQCGEVHRVRRSLAGGRESSPRKATIARRSASPSAIPASGFPRKRSMRFSRSSPSSIRRPRGGMRAAGWA